MANEKNLKPIRSASEAREKGKKGGVASGKKRREKKTVQKLLIDYLDTDARESPRLKELADAIGLEEGGSVKELIVMKFLFNSIKEGDLSDLDRLMSLLGEKKETSGSEEKLDRLLEEFKNAVKPETT